MNQYTVKLQNFEKQNHINSSILNRQITENNLQPNIDFRPIPTKYTHFNVFGNLQEKSDRKYRDYGDDIVKIGPLKHSKRSNPYDCH